ncbi:hypothetical protein N4G70_02005 [Streptomyces sp. ASQP_92]|uniref:hypothetical protein n=1 Tax=Streptomyces sp. ASQP_92 TaxID=2979116 RepID=UPI0021C22317|nr:hypothetical protein [Streptomyces sp. ASQP_92]MCT9087635.1 hypothetical protein [Streptomyces sp. ASQP_92]
MAWDEWEQLKADAVARDGGATRMQINGVPPDGANASAGSEVTGGLKTTKAAWMKAGVGVGDQREGLGKALTALSEGQKGLGLTEGCLTAAAQDKVYASWARYVRDLNEKCGSLQGILDQTGHDLLRTDKTVTGALEQVQIKYQDTPAVGGDARNR